MDKSRWKKEVCIIIDMMVVARSNGFKFKAYLNITHSKEKSTCRTSSNKTSLMKDDVKDEVPNGTPKVLNPSDGVLNKDGVSKLNDKLEGDHATHL